MKNQEAVTIPLGGLLRQGDVMLKRVDVAIPAETPKKEDKAVAYGEHSGHAHVATGEDTHVFTFEGKMYVSVGTDGGGMLEHIHLPTQKQADHNPLRLGKGVYEVILQNQFNPFSKMMEQVRD